MLNQQTFTEVSEPDFDKLVEDYIDRTSMSYGDMPVETFFDLLLERITVKTEATLVLEVTMQDNHLNLTPDREVSDIIVQGNEILVGGHRLVLQLASSHTP